VSLIFLIVLVISCGSEIQVDQFSTSTQDAVGTTPTIIPPIPGHDVTVISNQISNISSRGFDISVDVDDGDGDATVALYFCNETDTPSCDPLLGTSFDLTRVGNTFEISVTDLASPNDFNDIINYEVVVNDPDGVTVTPIQGQITLYEVFEIYRSVGPNNASVVDDNSTGTMTILNNAVTFSASVADNIGLGDVIVYDSDAKIAFITERIDSTAFKAKKADGASDPDPITANGDWKIYRAYTSFINAENGDENSGIPVGVRDFDAWIGGYDLVTNDQQWNLVMYADGVDDIGGSSVVIDGWTTDDSHRLKIFTPYLSTQVGKSQRHQGKMSYAFYKLKSTNADNLNIKIPYVEINGLQFEMIENDASPYLNNVHIDLSLGAVAGSEVVISNNIMNINKQAANYNCYNILAQNDASNSNIKNYIINNITYFSNLNSSNGHGIRAHEGMHYISNNTVHGASMGINCYAEGTCIAKNNIAQKFSGTYDAASDYNLSFTTNLPGGTNDVGDSSVMFRNEANFDLRLSPRDKNARAKGGDLSADVNFAFSQDILGKTRVTWDRGAHQAPIGIYRSVGPTNTTSLQVGTGNDLTISNTIATFASAIINKVGVGDVIEYDRSGDGSVDSLMFIKERIDAQNYIVQNNNGSDVSDLATADQDWSIFRAYTSLAAAESGDENIGINASLRDFDTWVDGRDLLTNNEEWNIILYADGVDSQVIIQDWVTSNSNQLNIYTPVNLNEVGISQRHNGRWTQAAYTIVGSVANSGTLALRGNLAATRIEGLQIQSHNSINSNGIYHGFTGDWKEEYFLGHNIIKGSGQAGSDGIDVDDYARTTHIYNNIIYDFNGASSFGISVTNGHATIYNNTLINNTTGVKSPGGGYSHSYLRNNLSSNNVSDYGSGGLNTFGNVSSDASSPDVALRNKTVSFIDAANDDYRLATNDVGAKDLAGNLSIDANTEFRISVDNMGHTRGTNGAWDVGAHEAANVIYRSMGYGSTTTLANGSGNDLTITAGMVNFSSSVADNIGVGDVIQFDRANDGTVDELVFIHSRTDSQNFTVRNALGNIPADLAIADQDWDIFRAYTSMQDQVTAVENTGILLALRDFDDYDGVPFNLFSNNLEANFTLYADAEHEGEVFYNEIITSGTNKLFIYPPSSLAEVGDRQRHEGKWNKNYFTAVMDGNWDYIGVSGYTSIDGLQVTALPAVTNANAVVVYNGKEVYVTNNIAQSFQSLTNYGLFTLRSGREDGADIYFINNLAYNVSTSSDDACFGFGSWQASKVTVHFYNNTAINCKNGFRLGSTAGTTSANFRNNLSINNTGNDFDAPGVSNLTTSNNISSDVTSPDGAGLQGKTIQFFNSLRSDYALASIDIEARNKGINLSSLFATDINGRTRGTDGFWDVGATEAATEIYRSIGPTNTATLANGTGNNLTISGSVVSFASAVADNIGVGDAIQYDRSGDTVIDSIMFIHSRTDSQNFTVRNSDGSLVSDLAVADQDWDIFRAYNDLEDLEAASENTGISGAVADFDTIAGRDLHGNNIQLNMALYGDGPATRWHLDDWVTSPTNYIYLFSPHTINEVGVSQRHAGKWDDTKARIEDNNYSPTLHLSLSQAVMARHIRFDGLQVHSFNSTAGNGGGIKFQVGFIPGEYHVTNSVIKRTLEQQGDGILLESYAGAEFVAVNNIIYDFYYGIAMASTATNYQGSDYYVYNNTINNSLNRGMHINAYGTDNFVSLKNNLVQNSGGSDYNFESTVESPDYTNNHSHDNTAPGSAAQTDIIVDFIGAISNDYRLGVADIGAKGNGVDLSADIIYPFDYDITGTTRSTWDIGAIAYQDYSTLTLFDELGAGIVNDPFQIFTKAQFQDLMSDTVDGCNNSTANACASYITINEDINLNNEAYTPIGLTNFFTGNLNGNGNTISNLTLSGGSPSALFANTCGASISNLIIDGVNISSSGNNYQAALIGDSSCGTKGYINNISVRNGTILAGARSGGIIGRAVNVDVTNSNSSLGVTCDSATSMCGGLAGIYDSSGALSNSYATGNVSGITFIGGLVGLTGSGSPTLTNCYATGKIIATGGDVGGLSSGMVGGAVTNCFATGDIISGGSSVGALIGEISGTTDITHSYATGDILAATQFVGGLIGTSSSSSSITDSWASGDVNATGDYVGGLVGDMANTTINDSFSIGNTFSSSTIAVGGFIGRNQAGATINRSYTIGNVTSTAAGTSGVGGFSGRNAGTINMSYASGFVFGDDYVGGFVGSNTGNINSSHATGMIDGHNYSGGFVGNHTAGIIDSCYTTADISAYNNVGGFAGGGSGAATISNSYNTNRVMAASTNIGGFIGNANSVTLTHNYSSTYIQATAAYGFVGGLTAATMTDNYWDSDSAGAINGSDIAASSVGDYEPFTLAQMQDENNFSDALAGTWDFTSTWTQLDERSMPIHKASPEGQCRDNISATTFDALGAGTLVDPYLICNHAQLSDIDSSAANCDKFYALGKDIDLSNYSSFGNEICGVDRFRGHFDGRNKSVFNFNTSERGLFHAVDTVVIKNLKIANATLINPTYSSDAFVTKSLYGTNYMFNIHVNGVMEGALSSSGGLFGNANSSESHIHNSSFIGSIESSSSSIGGIVGTSTLGSTHLYKTASYVELSGTAHNVGGLFGNDADTISKSKTFGSVFGATQVIGGLVGIDLGLVQKSYSAMNLQSSGGRIGGLVGYNSDVYCNMTNSYAFGGYIDPGVFDEVGGLVGTNCNISTSYADNTIDPSAINPGGVTGQSSSRNFAEVYWNTDYGVADGVGSGSDAATEVAGEFEARTYVELQTVAQYDASWDFTYTWIMSDGVRSPRLRWDLHPQCQANINAIQFDAIGTGDHTDPYLICFKEQLLDIGADTVNGCNGSTAAACSDHFVMLNDIDLKNETYAPIGGDSNPFLGSFDGKGHKIINLTINEPTGWLVGFFRKLGAGAYVSNINFVLVDVLGQDEVGALAGVHTAGTTVINNVHVQGRVKGSNANIGGLVGASYAAIKNCSSNIVMTTPSDSSVIGGLVGFADSASQILNSHAAGTITLGAAEFGVGGLVGTNRGIIRNSWANVDISGGDYLGGLIGRGSGGSYDVQFSYAVGDISGANHVGGFAGEITTGLTENNYALGSVSATGTYAAGFTSRSGGGSILKNYANGVVTGAVNNAGFVALEDAGTLDDNYWNSDNTTSADSLTNYEEIAEVDMDIAGNYNSWNFMTIWKVYPNRTPELIAP
jgi:hypothetical protein